MPVCAFSIRFYSHRAQFIDVSPVPRFAASRPAALLWSSKKIILKLKKIRKTFRSTFSPNCYYQTTSTVVLAMHQSLQSVQVQ